jgi:hypothetical protein
MLQVIIPMEVRLSLASFSVWSVGELLRGLLSLLDWEAALLTLRVGDLHIYPRDVIGLAVMTPERIRSRTAPAAGTTSPARRL